MTASWSWNFIRLTQNKKIFDDNNISSEHEQTIEIPQK